MSEGVNSDLIRLYDPTGKFLWQGSLKSGLPALAPGETIWIGTDKGRVWVKIMSIICGLDFEEKKMITELVVGRVEQGTTRSAADHANSTAQMRFIDHGIHKANQYGSSIVIGEGRIMVTVGEAHIGTVERISVQLNGPHGPTIESITHPEVGKSLKAENENGIVIATLTFANFASSIRITEYVKNS